MVRQWYSTIPLNLLRLLGIVYVPTCYAWTQPFVKAIYYLFYTVRHTVKAVETMIVLAITATANCIFANVDKLLKEIKNYNSVQAIKVFTKSGILCKLSV